MDEFKWTVELAGYKAVQVTLCDPAATIDNWLVAERTPSRNHGVRVYAPLRECAGIHRTFAAVEPNPSGVVAFANRYGFLGEPTTSILPPTAEGKSFEQIRGELLNDWYTERQALARALRLWDAICARNWNGLLAGSQPGCLDLIEEDHTGSNSELAARPPNWDLRRAASDLQKVVNERMDALKIQARLVWDLDIALFKGAFVPQDLLGALWTDFAIAVGENKGPNAFQACVSCGGFFEKSESKRRDARYCSDACKSKAYRRRLAVKRF